MEVAQYLIVAIGSALFGGIVGYKWGRETGRAEIIRRTTDEKLDRSHGAIDLGSAEGRSASQSARAVVAEFARRRRDQPKP